MTSATRIIMCCITLCVVSCMVSLGARTEDRVAADGFRRTAFRKPKDLGTHWNATDKNSREVSFKKLFGRPTVVILFRGHGCYHCVKQLAEVEKVESRFRSRGVRLIAISDEDVDSMRSALKSRPLPFPVLSDSESLLAKALGSDGIENWHGVVILDKKGKARWLIGGDKPLMDFREVVAVLDELKLSHRALKTHEFDKSKSDIGDDKSTEKTK